MCTDYIPKPTGYEYDGDLVFVTALVHSAATVVIQWVIHLSRSRSTYVVLYSHCRSGTNTVSISVPAGIHTVSGPMGTGSQVFTLKRDLKTIMSATGSIEISSSCTVNNFNAFVGSVKGKCMLLFEDWKLNMSASAENEYLVGKWLGVGIRVLV